MLGKVSCLVAGAASQIQDILSGNFTTQLTLRGPLYQQICRYLARSREDFR